MNLMQLILAWLFGWGQNNGGGGGGAGNGKGQGSGNGNGNGNGGNSNNNENTLPPTPDENVVIVAILGGGVAGLAAARELARAGMDDYLVLEAFDDHLGGRFWTEKEAFGEGTPTIEYGIRYVQGLQRNPLFELTKNVIGMRMHQVNYNKVEVYDENTQVLANPDIPWMEWDKAFVCAEEAGDALNQAGIDSSWQNGEVLLEDECGWINDSPIKDVLEWFDMDFEYGDAPINVSAYAFPEYTYMDFRPFDMFGTDPDGFESVVTYLTDDIDMDKVQMGSPVKSVEYLSGSECEEKGLTKGVMNDGNKNCVKISLEDEETIFAKFVISTIPFGVYNDNPKSLFPNAPQDWDTVVSKFFMGNYHSTYMQFTEKFWEDTGKFKSSE